MTDEDVVALIEVWRAKARWMRGIPGQPRTGRRIPEGRIIAIEECADELSASLQAAAPPAPTAEQQVVQLEWVLKRAEEIVGYEHGRDAAYAFTQAWGELPKELSAAPPERVSEGKE